VVDESKIGFMGRIVPGRERKSRKVEFSVMKRQLLHM
jgi:hypothetical protein